MHTSSSGGTHAGLRRRSGAAGGRSVADVPEVLAIGVAKGVNLGTPDIVELAADTLDLIGRADALVDASDVQLDPDWLGDDYAVPTAAGDDAIRWAAATGGWVLDRTYTGKGLAGLLGNAASRSVGAEVPTSSSSTPAACPPCSPPAAPPIRSVCFRPRRCVWSRQVGGV